MTGMTDPAQVHSSALVIDTHADTPQRFVDEHWNFTDPLNGGMLNYDSAKKGNLDAQFFSIWVDPNQYAANASARRTLELIDGTLEQVRKAPDKLQLCTTADQIIEAHSRGKFAVLMGIEGGHSIEDSLGLLRDYYRLGVRYMTLTWSNTNNWADSSGDIDDATIKHHDGLTPFGKQVVQEMNRLGMMVDISHVSDKTFWDTIATTRTPIIASHSSARALTQAGRNMTDDMLLAMKKNNGVVMVNFFPAFIDEQWRLAWNAQKPERQKAQDAMEADYKAKGLPVPYNASEQDRPRVRRKDRPRTLQLTHRSLRPRHQNRRHRPRRHRHRLRRHPRPTRRHRLRRRPPQGHRRAHGPRLHRRGHEQTPRRQSPPRLPRCAGRSRQIEITRATYPPQY